ncbi:MAG: carboxymuconolactone decarboxylase family protein [Bryobacteraceae bacterium]|nr:carboxymuconolactone decarboxylase family protein [Bryobacteraceae bacterium]
MTFEQFLDSLPEYAKDLKLNLSTLLRQPELTAQQIWGTALASAIASRNGVLTEVIAHEAVRQLSPEAMAAAKAAAAIMGMNNVYYRFTHLVENPKYGTIPARLRMNAIRTHGISPVDFELWCTAVSAVNGCGACMASHERVVREKGLTEEQVAASVRIASVMHAVATVLDGEEALAGVEPAKAGA